MASFSEGEVSIESNHLFEFGKDDIGALYSCAPLLILEYKKHCDGTYLMIHRRLSMSDVFGAAAHIRDRQNPSLSPDTASMVGILRGGQVCM